MAGLSGRTTKPNPLDHRINYLIGGIFANIIIIGAVRSFTLPIPPLKIGVVTKDT